MKSKDDKSEDGSDQERTYYSSEIGLILNLLFRSSVKL